MTENKKKKDLTLSLSKPAGKRDNVSLSYLLTCGLIFLLYYAKSVYFYVCIKIGLFSPVFAAASVCFIIVIFTMVSLINKRAGIIVLFTLYFLLSILMFVDVLYFSHFNKLPSVILLQLVSLLSDVDSSVVNLITLDRMIMIIDIPLWIIYAVFRKQNGESRLFPSIQKFTEKLRARKISFKAFFRVLTGLIIICIIAISSALMREDFTYEYFQNEILMYHIFDINYVYFHENEYRNVNPADYLYVYSAEEKDSDYYGIAQGRNLIVIQVEAMQEFVIDREYNGQAITPFLNSLLKEDTVFFDNYYYLIGGGNTADAEFAVNNSLYAPDSEAAYIKYQDNDFYGLPYILKDNGYTGAYAFHGYNGDFWNRRSAYVKQGFDSYTAGEDFEQTDIIGSMMRLSDYEFFSQSVEIMETYEQPFYSFMITLTSHHPYDNIPAKYSMLELEERHKEELFGNYLQSMRYVDWALEQLFAMLKESGLYENSVIVIYGDHFGLPNYDWYSKYYMTEFLGHQYYENDVFKVPLIINIPGADVNERISTTGSHIDVLPTLLHLFGIENRKSVMFGHNLFTAKTGIVYQQAHMSRGSFISDDVIYSIAQNGIPLNNKTYDKKTGNIVSSIPYRETESTAANTILDCMEILDNNAVIVNK